MIRIAIILAIIHFVYYLYFQVISDIIRIGMVRNTPNKIIFKLRTEFKVNIKTFQKNTNHYGFAQFKTIYLNESLFNKRVPGNKDKYAALVRVFHHEHYHLMHNHKAWTLIMRFMFSLVPLILIWNWIPFVIIYVLYAYGMSLASNKFEDGANFWAEYKTAK